MLLLLLCLYVPLGLGVLGFVVVWAVARCRKKRPELVSESYGSIRVPKELECAICLQSFIQKDKVAVLPCPHLFHPGCLEPWLQIQRRCPLCRTEITPAIP